MTTQDYFLSVRLKPAEHQKLKQLCQDSGLPASTVIRQLLVGAEVRPRRTKELKELYLAVNRIGTNINQIARKVNAGFGTRNDMQELLYLMGQLELQMSSIAER